MAIETKRRPAPPGEADTRARLIAAAARLFQEQGYAATGLNEILARAGAPKGSLYHHFPGGKAQLGAAAMRGAGSLLRDTLRNRRASAGDAAGAVEAFAGDLAGWLESSGFTRGCPVATVALEQTPGTGDLAEAAAGALSRTADCLAEMIEADGAAAPRARALAVTALAALEGAMILARTQQSGEPVRIAGAEMARVIRAEPVGGRI
jgi:TetR/AcrR family transcriptional repressor of lmrAB and yxaGH operons